MSVPGTLRFRRVQRRFRMHMVIVIVPCPTLPTYAQIHVNVCNIQYVTWICTQMISDKNVQFNVSYDYEEPLYQISKYVKKEHIPLMTSVNM